MTRTVVHVTTLGQWRSVLDVWFKQGHKWLSGNKSYHEGYFQKGDRYLLLNDDMEILIPTPNQSSYIEYQDFMSQQKEENNMETYYVTQEQLDLIKDLKNESINRLDYLLSNSNKAYKTKTFNHLPVKESNAILRYLGGDDTIEFKIKEQLHRLWRIDDDGDTVYMKFNSHGTPDSTIHEDLAFTAPLEEIKKHKTISWEIEEVK